MVLDTKIWYYGQGFAMMIYRRKMSRLVTHHAATKLFGNYSATFGVSTGKPGSSGSFPNFLLILFLNFSGFL
jgi:hypothetical protein